MRSQRCNNFRDAVSDIELCLELQSFTDLAEIDTIVPWVGAVVPINDAPVRHVLKDHFCDLPLGEIVRIAPPVEHLERDPFGRCIENTLDQPSEITHVAIGTPSVGVIHGELPAEKELACK